MIRRALQLADREPQFATGVLATPVAYINPWAECWGSSAPGPREQIQMQAEASMNNQPIQDSGEGTPCEEPLVPPVPSVEGGLVRVLPIVNNKGLHARASAKFVQTVEGFDATVKVSRCGETVGGQSIMGLMMLAAARGTTITVETSGHQAHACMQAIEALLVDKFGEES
jgi:phosphocarrier protein HPr